MNTQPEKSGICDACGKTKETLFTVSSAPVVNASICEDCFNVSGCRAEWRPSDKPRYEGDKTFVVLNGEEIVARDYLLPSSWPLQGAYLETAWNIFNSEPAPWKTLTLLRTLRQAIREHTAQGMDLDYPSPGASERQITKYLRAARVFDQAHHGTKTF